MHQSHILPQINKGVLQRVKQSIPKSSQELNMYVDATIPAYLQCVLDIVAFVFKFYTLFTQSLIAKIVVNPENNLILHDHSRIGWVMWIKIVLSIYKG